MVILTDQKVPQSVFSLENDLYSSQQEEFNIPNILGLDDFSTLEPVPASANVQTVSETNTDQRVYESQSPKSFVDLDNINGHGLSFYDETAMNIKPEKDINHISYNCSMHDMESTQYPVYQQNIKQEDFVFEDIGASVIRQLKEEINNTCTILRISPDPIQWSPEDVRKWFVWNSQQFSVPSGIYENFMMSGEQLCQLTDEDFKERSPEAGSNFYGQLEVWKNACGLDDIDCPPSPQSQVTCYDYCNQGYYNCDGTYMPPCSTSPSPSEESLDSTSSSNISYIPQPCQDDDYISYVQSPPIRSRPEHEHKQTIHLWQFLKDLLLQPDRYNCCIKWIDRQRGIFKIEDSSKVAKLWGLRKNRPAMNYDKLSRSIRQYYKKGIIKKTEHSKRLVYQFCQPYL